MSRLIVVLQREYTLRLRKPAFWLTTLLVPLVLAALYALPVAAAHRHSKPATVLVVDQTGLFEGRLQSTDAVHFKAMPSLDYAERQSKQEKADAILFIPLRQTTIPHDAFLYYRRHEPSSQVQNAVAGQLQTLLRNAILEDVYDLAPSDYHTIEATHIALHTQDSATGHESFAGVKSTLSLVLTLLMALTLLLFGVQTVQAVQEERQNRTAEVLATSIDPMALLLGKLAATALAALTQLLLWSALTALMVKGIELANPQLFAEARQQQAVQSLATKGSEATAAYGSTVQLVDEAVRGLTAIRLPMVAATFALFFLLGYLLLGTVLAAIASRLDSDADALLWTLLASSPLLAVAVLLPALQANPGGALATWLTLCPLTAAAAVPARLPFGLPLWQAAVAALLMAACIAAAALLAARAYRRNLLR